jgi:hypothetical protein
LLHGVEEVGLEAVEGFDGAFDAGGFRFGSDGAVDGGGPFELGLRGVFAGELAEYLVVGATKGLDAGVVTALDDAFEVIDSALAARDTLSCSAAATKN